MAIRFPSFFIVLAYFLSASSCAYHFGPGNRSVPGGYKSVSIPLFKNRSYETGVEVSFTNSLLQEFQRSKIARVVDESLSEVRIEGEITDIAYTSTTKKVAGDSSAPYLPDGTVLTTEYQILVTAKVKVLRRSDNIEIWAGSFSKERTYSAPQVTISGLNSVNPLYNLSARRQNIESLAQDMMAEAHSRMTESF